MLTPTNKPNHTLHFDFVDKETKEELTVVFGDKEILHIYIKENGKTKTVLESREPTIEYYEKLQKVFMYFSCSYSDYKLDVKEICQNFLLYGKGKQDD